MARVPTPDDSSCRRRTTRWCAGPARSSGGRSDGVPTSGVRGGARVRIVRAARRARRRPSEPRSTRRASRKAWSDGYEQFSPRLLQRHGAISTGVAGSTKGLIPYVEDPATTGDVEVEYPVLTGAVMYVTRRYRSRTSWSVDTRGSRLLRAQRHPHRVPAGRHGLGHRAHRAAKTVGRRDGRAGTGHDAGVDHQLGPLGGRCDRAGPARLGAAVPGARRPAARSRRVLQVLPRADPRPAADPVPSGRTPAARGC